MTPHDKKTEQIKKQTTVYKTQHKKLKTDQLKSNKKLVVKLFKK